MSFASRMFSTASKPQSLSLESIRGSLAAAENALDVEDDQLTSSLLLARLGDFVRDLASTSEAKFDGSDVLSADQVTRASAMGSAEIRNCLIVVDTLREPAFEPENNALAKCGVDVVLEAGESQTLDAAGAVLHRHLAQPR